MMLQGHFIDTLLAVEYRNDTALFTIWKYFRGITAPVFFTISGLIFTYLLLKAKENKKEFIRIKKGITRGFFLIGVGYLLRIPIFQWLSGSFNTYFLVIDVLQCIGLSLILLVLLYIICLKKINLFFFLSFALGFIIFVTEPWYRNLNFNNVPLLISNYISKSNGSIFTIIPWFGYICYGASLAVIFLKYLKIKNFKPAIITVFIIVGLSLIFYSSKALILFSNFFDIQLFYDSANYNYLFTRLGNVLLYFAFFYLFEAHLKSNLILKIGQKTLSIYVIHFIIMYGSFTGVGLNSVIGKNLNPIEVIIGAILFLIIVCFISFNYTKPNKYLYNKLNQVLKR